MVVATIAVHAPNGIWNQNGWVEFTVTNIAIALAFVGSGAWSLDATLGLDRTCMGSGSGWGTLAVGVVAAVATLAARRHPQADQHEPVAGSKAA